MLIFNEFLSYVFFIYPHFFDNLRILSRQEGEMIYFVVIDMIKMNYWSNYQIWKLEVGQFLIAFTTKSSV